MSNKRKRQICKLHIIGQYLHKRNGFYNVAIKSDIEEKNISLGILYYNYCPACGERITEKIKTYQMNFEIRRI